MTMFGAGGGGGPDPPTVTLSNVEVFSVDVSMLVTASPIVAFGEMPVVTLPTVVHEEPSPDTDPVTVLPLRESRSHAGTGRVAPARYVVSPPIDERVMNSMLPSGRKSRMTCAAFAAVDCRSMTPAFANVLVI